MLIILTGRKQHGKDTCAEYLCKKYKFVQLAFAKPLKDCCKLLFGLSDEQLYGDLKEIVDERWGVSPRQILQFVGTDLFRDNMSRLIPNVAKNFWVSCVKMECIRLWKQDPMLNIVISDGRFSNELDLLNEFRGISIKIIRPNYEVDSTSFHESERCIDDLKTTFDISNDGTIDDLYKKIDKLVCPILSAQQGRLNKK